MCLVGENFEESSDEVCGAVVQIRAKGDKIAIWTGNAKKEHEIRAIGYVYVCVVCVRACVCACMYVCCVFFVGQEVTLSC